MEQRKVNGSCQHQGMGWPSGDAHEESRQKNHQLGLPSAWMNTEKENLGKYGLVFSPKNLNCGLKIAL